MTNNTSRIYWSLFIFLSCIYLVPLILVDYLPFVDYPVHLAEIQILSSYKDEIFKFEQYYDIFTKPHPYQFHQIFLVLLAKLIGVHSAYICFIAMYVVGTPLAITYYLIRIKRPPWPALLAFSFIYNWPFMFGFISYCVAVTICLASMLSLEAVINNSGRNHYFVIFGASLLIFLLHPHVFLYWVVIVGVFIAIRAVGKSLSIKSLIVIAASLMLPIVLGLLHSRTFDMDSELSLGFHYPTVQERLHLLPLHTIFVWKDAAFGLITILFILY